MYLTGSTSEFSLPDRCHQNLNIYGPIAIAWPVGESEAASTVNHHVAGQLPGAVNCRPGRSMAREL